MRLAIINLTGGGVCEGYRKYLKNMIPLIARHNEIEALLCAAPDSWHIDEEIGYVKNVKFVKCPPYKLFGKLDAGLISQLDSFCPDVIFVPVERYFKYKNIPVMNMLQNMSPTIAQPSLGLSIRYKIQYAFSKIAIVKSDRVIAISNFVRDFLITKLRVSPDKIALIYFGIRLEPGRNVLKPDALQQEMSKRFIFTAGSIWHARGLEDLILAARGFDFDSLGIKGIVIAGEMMPNMLGCEKRLLNLIKANNLTSRFIFLGKVDYSQMEWCYENCRIFVMTSRVEACPNIALEAMVHGSNCVAADNPPLPEFFQNCAVYYKPKDPLSLAESINSVLMWNDDKKEEMSRKSQRRAAEFSWDKTADALIEELKKCRCIAVRRIKI